MIFNTRSYQDIDHSTGCSKGGASDRLRTSSYASGTNTRHTVDTPTLPARLRWLGRRLVLGGYYRVVHANYTHQWLAPTKQTPGGSIRSYDLYNRHGTDEMLAAIESRCGSDSVVYDVGANVGTYSLSLAAGGTGRRILAFEPAPPVATQLQANVAVNGFEDRIDVRAHGLGDTADVIPFYVSSYTELSAFDRESAERWEAHVREICEVRIDRLDTIAEETTPPDIVKIDVEGAGAAVLRGATQTLESVRPIIFLEIHEDGLAASTTAECRKILQSHSYDVVDRGEYWICVP